MAAETGQRLFQRESDIARTSRIYAVLPLMLGFAFLSLFPAFRLTEGAEPRGILLLCITAMCSAAPALYETALSASGCIRQLRTTAAISAGVTMLLHLTAFLLDHISPHVTGSTDWSERSEAVGVPAAVTDLTALLTLAATAAAVWSIWELRRAVFRAADTEKPAYAQHPDAMVFSEDNIVQLDSDAVSEDQFRYGQHAYDDGEQMPETVMYPAEMELENSCMSGDAAAFNTAWQ